MYLFICIDICTCTHSHSLIHEGDQLVVAWVWCVVCYHFNVYLSQMLINIDRMLIIHYSYFQRVRVRVRERARKGQNREKLFKKNVFWIYLHQFGASSCARIEREYIFDFFSKKWRKRKKNWTNAQCESVQHLGLFLDCYGISFWFDENRAITSFPVAALSPLTFIYAVLALELRSLILTNNIAISFQKTPIAQK